MGACLVQLVYHLQSVLNSNSYTKANSVAIATVYNTYILQPLLLMYFN